MASEKDIEYEELGPGKGARITLTGETAEEVEAAAKNCGMEPEEVLIALIEAYVKDPHLQEEVTERLREETKSDD